MMEVVKKEVLKLLQADMIFPISDSQWINQTQVVPKKGGITMIETNKVSWFLHELQQVGESALTTVTWMR